MSSPAHFARLLCAKPASLAGLCASTVNPQTFMQGEAARCMGVYCLKPLCPGFTLAFIKRGSCRFANLNIMPITLILHFFQDCNTRNAFSRFPPKLPAFFPVFRTDCTLPWPFCQGKISRFVQKSLNPTPKSEYCPIGIPYGSIYI